MYGLRLGQRLSSPTVRTWTPPDCERRGKPVATWCCHAANSLRSCRQPCRNGSHYRKKQTVLLALRGQNECRLLEGCLGRAGHAPSSVGPSRVVPTRG